MMKGTVTVLAAASAALCSGGEPLPRALHALSRGSSLGFNSALVVLRPV